jgi:hypothetical protein
VYHLELQIVGILMGMQQIVQGKESRTTLATEDPFTEMTFWTKSPVIFMRVTRCLSTAKLSDLERMGR